MENFREVCENIASGKNKSRTSSGKYPVYGSTGIIAYTNSCSYSEELLLVARVGANAGFVHRARGQYDVSDNTLIIKPKNGYNFSFSYYQLLNMKLNNLAVGGGQPLITAGKLKNSKSPFHHFTNKNALCLSLINSMPLLTIFPSVCPPR